MLKKGAWLLSLSLLLLAGCVNSTNEDPSVDEEKNDSELNSAEQITVKDIQANLFIDDAGEMVDSFEIQIEDILSVQDLKEGDFEITGNYDGYPVNQAEEMVQEDFEDDGIELSIEGDSLILDVKDFKYPGGVESEYKITNEKYPALSFSKEDVTSINTKTVDQFEKATFTGGNDVTIPYRISVANSEKSEPLVIWMHGAGEVGTDNESHIRANRGAVSFAESDYVTSVIAAQYPYAYSEELTDEELQDMLDFFKAYRELIDSLVEDGTVDPDHIYLTGASMGGGLTLRFMLEEPELFAGVVTISSRGTVKDLEELNKVDHLPIWLFHAEDDPTNPSTVSKDIYNKLKDLGNDEAKLTIYDTEYMHSLNLYGGLLHWGWVPALNDSEMMDWLFAQKKIMNH